MIIFTLLVTGVKSYRIYITFEDQKKAYKSRQVSLDQPFNWSGIWREGQIRKHEGYLVNFADRIDSYRRVIERWSDWIGDLKSKDVRLLAEWN